MNEELETVKPWYVAINERQQGPLRLSDLVKMVKIGELTASMLVWTKGMTDWTEAAKVPELEKLWSVEQIQQKINMTSDSENETIVRLNWKGRPNSINNPKFTVILDGQLIAEPFFRDSYTQDFRVKIGNHLLVLSIIMPGIFQKRPKQYTLFCNTKSWNRPV